MVSLYDTDESAVVEAVQRDERARIDDLDGLPERIRAWEHEDERSQGLDTEGTTHAP